MGFLIRELLDAGLLHADVQTVLGRGLDRFRVEPWLDDGRLAWRDAALASGDENVLRPAARPFSSDGGLKLLRGNLGRAVVKTSAIASRHRRVLAPAVVVDSQEALIGLSRTGGLERDLVAVVRGQGPQANGMPELHKLTPILGVLQDRGFQVALVTDGRMSGASGKVPAAIHVSPEAVAGGPIAGVRDGDLVLLDCDAGRLEVQVPDDELARRAGATVAAPAAGRGYGRELFGVFRRNAGTAERGACALFSDD
jgi:phosphogluconate dehydratase